MKHWTDGYLNMNRQPSRIDVIGQNGNTGEHYSKDDMVGQAFWPGAFQGQMRLAFYPGAVKVLEQWDGHKWVEIPEVMVGD